MEKAFGWLGQFFDYLLKLIPILVVVPTVQGGVLFSRGKHIREWKPGVHWYWPIVSTYKTMVVVRQNLQIQPRLTMTRDGCSAMVGGLITYEINDVVTAITRNADIFSDTIDRTLPVLLGMVATKTLTEINADREDFNQLLTKGVDRALESYGVKILQVQLTEVSPCRAINHTGHMAVGQYTIWTEYAR